MASLFEKLAGNLLDLGLRNKLLNFKDQKLRSIEITDPDPDELYSLLNSEKDVYFIDNEEDDEEEGLIVFEEEKPQALRRNNEIVAHKKGEKTDYILKHLKKFNDSAIIEKGINILYVALGFLNWKEADFSKYDLKSPLLLVPVTLDYDKGAQSYVIRKTDDDIVVNPSLKAKLDLDFKLVLPEFLPDEDTIDSYLVKVEEAITEDDWFVDNKTYLGIFSFAKLTMYNDLKTNEGKMSNSPLISAIYNGDETRVDRYFNTDYDDYFNKGDDIKLFNVVDADSSQIEAILEAKKGKSFVIQGPPGTGKSQTITNIIAELLNDGKKVLFVSEKKAALDVVFNNLKRVGLDDYCFQVHSDKMNKKEFVAELHRVLPSHKANAINRNDQLALLKRKKEQLDNYCKILYKNIEPLNLRVFDIINAVHKYKKNQAVFYQIKDIQNKDLTYLVKCKDALDKFALYDGSTDFSDSPWYGFDAEKYNYENFGEILDLFNYAIKYIKQSLLLSFTIGHDLGREYKTIESINYDLHELMEIVEVPYYDREILKKAKRKSLVSSFDEIKDAYKKSRSLKDKILSKFKEDILSVDYDSCKRKFENQYRSVFRVFNKSYKLDKKYFCSLLLNTRNKIGYNAIINVLDDISRYYSSLDNLKTVISKIEDLSDYDYDLETIESVTEISEKIRKYHENHKSLDLSLADDADVEELAKNIYSVSQILSSDQLSKYSSIQNYFIKDYIDFSNKEYNYVLNKLESCVNNKDDLMPWIRFYTVWKPIEKLGLAEFVDFAIDNGIDKKDLSESYSYCFYKEWMMIIYYRNEELKHFRRSSQDLTVEQFKKLDKELLALDRKQIAASIKNRLYDYTLASYGSYYNSDPVARKELSILEHEANKKRAIKPIRVMFKEIPHLLYRIKPCLLMSPLSVATYLTYEPNAFDVVIFDEASQIFPWDAIGAISRSKAVIVVGDSKQMPPTNFFMASTGGDDEYDEEADENVADYESILDLCTAVLPQKMLNWHYRSKTESLIAFSNKSFYGNHLVTFPSSAHDSDDFGIKFHYVKNGVFVNRQNVKEAEAVADLVYEHFRKHPERSLGVVCFSINQQALLEDLIDERRRKSDPYSKFFDQNINEPFFIKNLETVQGDERDTIIFSIGYGRDAAGNLKHNFGPLNRKGGERRLNVAITRAKYNVQVVSSIRSFDIDLNRTQAEGARLLKEYLDLAENGLKVLNKDLVVDSDADSESAFEEDVASVIREAGYNVDLQVGCSGYRIDMCVKHPKNNDYVLAVECDGRTYHSSKRARDRDRLRQEVLEKLGWTFYRIWSTDWFVNRGGEKQHLLDRIEKAILDYDIAAKEKEERDRVVVEERYKDVVENTKVSSRPDSISLFNDKIVFTETLNPQEQEYVKKFNSELEKSAYKFIFDEREFIFAYKLKLDVDNGNSKAWFWIGKNGSGLVFKIKNNLDDIAPSRQFPLGKQGGAVALARYVLELCEKRYPPAQEADAFEDDKKEVKEAEEQPVHSIVKNDRFFFQIAKAVQGRRVVCKDMIESNVVNDVLDFVMNEICHNAISNKLFKDKQDFDMYKYSRRCTYSFFGITFSLGNVSRDKAEEFYYYFVASKVISKIKSYEGIFKNQIIVDSLALLKSLYKMIRINEVDISRCDGLNSNMALVPESALIEVIDRYTKLCWF